jgi:hypothetical protein
MFSYNRTLKQVSEVIMITIAHYIEYLTYDPGIFSLSGTCNLPGLLADATAG